MPRLELTVLSLRYSSWSMRPWLALTHAGADFETKTVELPQLERRTADSLTALTASERSTLAARRALGSINGLFPVLRVDDVPIHESLAICEYAAETFPGARLWPEHPLHRARARAISCEMLSGFSRLRGEMSCHLFGRVPGFEPGDGARAEIARVFEIWDACLQCSGGPFLFGDFCIADAMYFPVLTRFRTYGVPIPGEFSAYTEAVDQQPAVRRLLSLARTAPRMPVYDEYLRELGGDPDAAIGI